MIDSATSSTMRSEILDFLKQVEKLLIQQTLTSKTVENFKSDFYQGEAPFLAIFLGPPSAELLNYVRSQFPSFTIIFWLYPPLDTVPQAFLDASKKLHNVLICPLKETALFLEKISILIQEISERKIRLISLEGMQHRFQKEYLVIQKAIAAELSNAEQDRNRGLVRLRCSIHNLPSIIKNRHIEIKNVDSSIPLVICGAGPSLRNDLSLLKAVSDTVNIFAVGHAVKPLLEYEIIPDVVVEVDSYAFRNWQNVQKLPSLLVACTEVAPCIVDYFDHILWCYGSSPAFNLLARKLGIELTDVVLQKTVTVPALSLAIKMGFRKIALLGQDFALGDNNLTHADGSSLISFDSLCELPGLNGKTVKSTRGLATLRESFQEYVANLKEQFIIDEDRPIIVNCSSDGAKIEGLEQLPFEKFVKLFATSTSKAQALFKCAKKAQYSVEFVEKEKTLWKSLADIIFSKSVCYQSDGQVGKLDEHILFLQKMLEEKLKPISKLIIQKIREATYYLKNNEWRTCLNPYSFVYQLMDDLVQDLDESLYKLKHSNVKKEDIFIPYSFKAFRSYAIARVAEGGHKEFAEWLQHNNSRKPPDKFDCRLVNQVVPFITLKIDTNKFMPLSGFENMMEIAKLRVEEFVLKERFVPDNFFVIFAAPANWIYVMEFFRKYPRTEGCILENYPELFSYLINFGLFLHLIRAGTPIIACNQLFLNWSDLLLAILKQQIHKKRQIVIFKHPECSSLPEVQNFYIKIDELIKQAYET